MIGEQSTPPTGLTLVEAQRRLAEYGPNQILRSKKVSPFKILLQQFSSPLILILIAAAGLSMAMGYLPDQEPHLTDAALIMAIVLLSGIFGFIQDYRAEKTMEALQKMTSPKARLFRGGAQIEIPASDVVPGDLLLLKAGDVVAADGQVTGGYQLEVDESILTGESIAIIKTNEEEVFMNTSVTSGHANILVEKTGMQTRIGQIAGGLQEIQSEQTSFQKELVGLSKKLSLMALFITAIIGAVGYFKYGLYQGLMTAISLAVAAVPEGLPAVVVLALAIGAKLMAKKNALIRRLSTAESIGAINLICTDKTGTLTKNEMSVTKVFYDQKRKEVDSLIFSNEDTTLDTLLRCGWHCNNVKALPQSDGSTTYVGEQTELAIYKMALSFLQKNVNDAHLKVNEVPFNSERKMMSVVLENGQGQQTVYAKGAPEILIHLCDRITLNGQVIPMTPKLKEEILSENIALATKALRVIGFAYKPTGSAFSCVEENLIWIGLQAMIDPPRPEVKQAIADCYTAGIRVIMITGDNPMTAKAIADWIGMKHRGPVLTGQEIQNFNDAELQLKLAQGNNIFARTTPFHKLRILDILEKDFDVAMTGDGVNDALAVKRAAVGIAMGKKGTEVTKQVSDIILLDDNFSTIRDAIRQGRTIFYNIRKFIDYLLTCNIAEVMVLFLATLFFDLEGPVLLAVQILWINLLTDGLIALSLGADPPAKDTMLHAPRKLGEPLIDRHLTYRILSIGSLLTVLLLFAFHLTLSIGLDTARTVLLTGFVIFEFVRIGAIRQNEQLGWLANKWLIGALVVSVAIHLVIVYSPLNSFFHLVPLGLYEWSILFGGAIIGYFGAFWISKILPRFVPT